MKFLKTFAEWTGTLVGKLVLLAITIALLCALCVAGYYAYLDTHSAAAKRYLIEKYDIDDFDYMCTSMVEYTYSDISDCDNTWLKECTDDENLAYKYVFTKKKTKTTITVVEDKNGDFEDDYENKDKSGDLKPSTTVPDQSQ